MMRIAFDASPLIGDLVSGVGKCEGYQTAAIATLHPEWQYRFEYFTMRSPEEKKRRMHPYVQENTPIYAAKFSPMIYRAVSTFFPLPYSAFFGDWADVTHFFNYIVPPGVHGKTVVTVHDMVLHNYPETMSRRTRALLKYGLKKSMSRADCIVTDSQFSKEEIGKYYPEFIEKVRVVPCGVDTRQFHPVKDPAVRKRVRENYGISRDYFFYLGTLEPRKNLVRLIQAYAQLLHRHPDAPLLVLAGGRGWEEKEIFETVIRLHLQKQVVFPSYIPAKDLPALYSGAIAFVFPSLYEGFGMPPLEAMACGTPVIASKAASLPEATGHAAILVDPYQTEAIAKGMELVLEDSSLRAGLSRLGLRRAAKMQWEHSAELLYEIYRALGEKNA